GARYPNGLIGLAIVVLIAVLVSSFFSAVSCAMALVLRSDEELIGMSQMLALPLIFLSSVLMVPELLPDWISAVATVNPVDWAAQASREALGTAADWALIGLRGALLLLVWLNASILATLAFRSYRRNI